MNPWALVVIALGVLVMILGVKGSYGNVVNALKSGGSNTTATARTPSPVRPSLL